MNGVCKHEKMHFIFLFFLFEIIEMFVTPQIHFIKLEFESSALLTYFTLISQNINS